MVRAIEGARRWPARLGVLVVVVGVVAALRACDPGAGAEPAVGHMSICQAAFSEMASARQGVANIVLADTESRSLRYCGSPDEWLAGAGEVPGAIPDGTDPQEVLRDLCSRAESADRPACSAPRID
ncbi:hypothetical protein [Sanguibacter antarcticus]|uniref:Uncharacterized protein n=1 Tax=Sanguibacter antarcticus TaxID=372484 RepID=A0A2A9E762_9MICO|nr:hypothetical protein [Sanguibacter antarcticus]PFG34381.1 hypothetical protein ATL42_2291 [Sanguibacter antarcticus]